MNKLLRIIYKYLIRPILFFQDPEKVHNRFTQIGHFFGKYSLTKKVIKKLFYFQHPSLEQKILGIDFKNPVGLSAGFDKDANLINILPEIGFGFVQVGSITYHPCEGNPKPRLYRLLKSKAIVVYYGLNNIGVKKIIKKMKKEKRNDSPISVSIAKTNSPKTKTTQSGIDDYLNCFKELLKHNINDFYTINISCPNTFGGEPFTTPEKLNQLLKKLSSLKIKKPVFLKMPINLKWNKFKKLLEIGIKYKISGVIIGNLNKNHQDKSIKDKIPSKIKGGISGKPTWQLSNNLISKTYQEFGNKLIIIGVGGIFSGQDAYEKIKLGSSLVQLITGMIYQGPQLIGEINKDLVDLLKKDGYQNIQQAVGSYHQK